MFRLGKSLPLPSGLWPSVLESHQNQPACARWTNHQNKQGRGLAVRVAPCVCVPLNAANKTNPADYHRWGISPRPETEFIPLY